MDINKQDMNLDEAISVIKEIDPNYEITSSYNAESIVLNAVRNGEIVPVVHGEWIIENIYPPSIGTHCDNCGWAWSNGIDAVKLNPVFSLIKTNYCPNCGAKMDGKEQEDEQTN